MSERARTRWTIAGIVAGWALTIAGLIWAVAGADALEGAQLDTQATAIQENRARIDTLEKRNEVLVELRNDMTWVKASLKRIENGGRH